MERKKGERSNKMMGYKLNVDVERDFDKICKKKNIGKCTMARNLVTQFVEENRDLIKQ